MPDPSIHSGASKIRKTLIAKKGNITKCFRESFGLSKSDFSQTIPGNPQRSKMESFATVTDKIVE